MLPFAQTAFSKIIADAAVPKGYSLITLQQCRKLRIGGGKTLPTSKLFPCRHHDPAKRCLKVGCFDIWPGVMAMSRNVSGVTVPQQSQDSQESHARNSTAARMPGPGGEMERLCLRICSAVFGNLRLHESHGHSPRFPGTARCPEAPLAIASRYRSTRGDEVWICPVQLTACNSERAAAAEYGPQLSPATTLRFLFWSFTAATY